MCVYVWVRVHEKKSSLIFFYFLEKFYWKCSILIWENSTTKLFRCQKSPIKKIIISGVIESIDGLFSNLNYTIYLFIVQTNNARIRSSFMNKSTRVSHHYHIKRFVSRRAHLLYICYKFIFYYYYCIHYIVYVCVFFL